jgi:hypothetical protein
MKHLILISIIFICIFGFKKNFSLTDEQKDFIEAYDDLYKETMPKVKACEVHKKSIVQKAYREVHNPRKKNEFIQFIPHEKTALKYIDAFDLNKTSSVVEYKFTKLLLDNCSEDTFKIINSPRNKSLLKRRYYDCFNAFPNLDFMKALIFATKNYNWSPETKLKARKKILDYIAHISSSDKNPFIHHAISITILETMTRYDLIEQKHHALIISANKGC